jgi:hypothetical protein
LFRLNEKEYEELAQKVAESSLSREAFIRQSCLEDGQIIIVDRDLMKKLYTEINRLGNNINQIAHVANSSKNISEHEIKMVIEWQRQLQLTVSRELEGIRK